MQRRLLRYALPSAFLVVCTTILLSSRYTVNDHVVWIDGRTQDDHAASLEQALEDYHKAVLNTLRRASTEYPVPYVREQLAEILRGVDQRGIVVATFYTSDPGYEHLYARFRRTEDDRPMIQIFFTAQARFVQDFIERIGTDTSEVVDPLLTDWYVATILHEWVHYKRGHRYDEAVTPEIHLQQESEAWATIFERVVYPAIRERRFSFPLDDGIVYGYACWVAANGDTKHPAWKAFMRFTEGNAPLEELMPYLPRTNPK